MHLSCIKVIQPWSFAIHLLEVQSDVAFCVLGILCHWHEGQ